MAYYSRLRPARTTRETPGETSRSKTRPTTTGVRRFRIPASNVTCRAFPGDNTPFVYALIYPVKSVSASGVATANDASIYVGRDTNFLPISRAANDGENYIDFSPPAETKARLADIFVMGTAGDGIVVEYGAE